MRGDLVMKGYYKDPEDRRGVDGWQHTGDIGYSTRRLLHIIDRKKDMIISGGFNVYPGESRAGAWCAIRRCRTAR